MLLLLPCTRHWKYIKETLLFIYVGGRVYGATGVFVFTRGAQPGSGAGFAFDVL